MCCYDVEMLWDDMGCWAYQLWVTCDRPALWVQSDLKLTSGDDNKGNKSEMVSYMYNDLLSDPAMSDTQFLVGAAPGTYINSGNQNTGN